MALHAITAQEEPKLRNLANRRICSSLFLQQLLYYTVWYDIAWLIFWFAWLSSEYWNGLWFHDNDIVRTVMTIFFFIGEPIRLAAGFYGNLHENVPWIVIYSILSLAPLCAPCYYYMLGGFRRTPLTKAFQVVQAIMLGFSIFGGAFTARRMYVLQKQQYYLFEYALNKRRRQQEALETRRRLDSTKAEI